MKEPNTPLQPLDYEPALLPDRCIAIRDTDVCLQITLGACPAWITWVGIITMGPVTLTTAIGTAAIITLRLWYFPFDAGVITLLAVFHVMALRALAVVVSDYAQYRKWGRRPGTLIIEAAGVTFVRPRGRSLRRTFWPAASIKRLSVRRFKPFLSTKAMADLQLGVRRGFSQTFRLASRDPGVIDIVEARVTKLWKELAVQTPALDSK